MRVERISTLRLEEFPSLLFLQVHTDDGLTGLGETYFGAQAVEAYVHETVAPYLLGQDALALERHARALRPYVGFNGGGVEVRGNSALDIALWDLLGQVTGQPLYQLLGGRTRERIRVYNTCAGYRYARGRQVAVDNWGLAGEGDAGPYEDLEGFLERPDELAHSLLDEGFDGMKIWPFDTAAKDNGGRFITAAQMRAALEPFRRIREAVGDRIDIMVELHTLWNRPTAERICKALEDYDPFWYEDPVPADQIDSLSHLAAATSVPIAASETLAGHTTFGTLLQHRAADVVLFDLTWVGGVGEARKIATLADAHDLPVAAHDCTGPVNLTASTHLAVSQPNAMIQEVVRAFYSSWYRQLLTDLPQVADGTIAPPDGPGLGVSLLPDLHERADAHQRVSALDRR